METTETERRPNFGRFELLTPGASFTELEEGFDPQVLRNDKFLLKLEIRNATAVRKSEQSYVISRRFLWTCQTPKDRLKGRHCLALIKVKCP